MTRAVLLALLAGPVAALALHDLVARGAASQPSSPVASAGVSGRADGSGRVGGSGRADGSGVSGRADGSGRAGGSGRADGPGRSLGSGGAGRSLGSGGAGRADGSGGWVRLLVALGRRVGVLPAPGDLVARLLAAGSPWGLGPGDLMAAKAGAAVVGAVAVAPVLAAAPGRVVLTASVGAAVAGYLGPDLWLRRRTGRRRRAMAQELADVMDLLRVCVDAGLTPARAMAEVGARQDGLLARELAGAAARIEIGVDRESALARLSAAAPLPAVAALVAAVQRGARHGAPLGPALRAIAVDARAEHARAVAESAARAAPKIQLVVALLLVPAVMLLVGAAVLRGLGVA